VRRGTWTALAVAVALACKKEPPPPPPECDAQRPCKDWYRCVAGSCMANITRVPKPPQLQALEAADERDVLVRGQLEAGTSVEIFFGMGCASNLMTRASAAQLAEGVRVSSPLGLKEGAAISARALSPLGQLYSPCVEAMLPAQKPKVEVTDDDRAQWSAAREAQAQLAAKLPPGLADAVRAAGYAPLGAIPYVTSFLEADLDCDGKPDYALLALPLSDAMLPALASAAPADDVLAAQLARLRRMNTADEQAELLVALRAPSGFRVSKQGAATGLALTTLAMTTNCTGKNFDRAWAEAHSCPVLGYGGTESGGGSLAVFDHASGKLVELEGCAGD